MNINIQSYQKQIVDLAGRFRDIRFTGQVVFAGIVLLISWSGVKTIQTNYELQKQISTIRQQNAVMSLENSNLDFQNKYFETDDYLELSARRNYGLGKQGESVILVPQQVAFSYAPASAVAQSKPAEITSNSSNFKAWVDLFLNRQN